MGGPLGATDLAVVALVHARATDPSVTGTKAAALARAASLGLPVLPGFVLTTGSDEPPDVARDPWEALSRGGSIPLVVRSSSTVEDVEESSMAGRFCSVLDVRGWEAFEEAVGRVRASAGEPSSDVPPEPMAVLVQPQLVARCGGVMFGLDPVTGDRTHLVVEAVSGGPDALVSGRVTGTRYLLSHRGGVVERDGPDLLPRGRRRRLARLVGRAERAFGGPQDVEWAFDTDDRLWLFQSRPVTAAGAAADATGPYLGPGPVAETFPEPLSRLERELFLEPLRTGIVRALRTVGATPRRRIARSPVVTTVGGWVAADLELFGVAPVRRSAWRFLNPVPPARQLAIAWRVGRLRRSLPRLAVELLGRVDAQLAAAPSPRSMSDRELLWLLQRARRQLVAVHGYEVLAGMLLPRDGTGPTAAGAATAALAEGRRRGLRDAALVAAFPQVLALTPPRIGAPAPLPAEGAQPAEGDPPRLGEREAMRLRARWLDELEARAASELGRRLADAGRLPSPDAVRELSIGELVHVVCGDRAPADLAERLSAPEATPLPSVFRLTPRGEVAPARLPRGRSEKGGRGAGGGRGMGRVHQLSEGPPDEPGEVLVVRVLEPGLAAALPHLAGLISETGSTLSHLAILARESGVPTVVGVEDALTRYPPGTLLVVDGTTGDVLPIVEEVSS